MCGADVPRRAPGLTEQGSSPRVRSRPTVHCVSPPDLGIISACAEQTGLSAAVVIGWGDHLRVCGADWSAMSLKNVALGSSPRVRSRPVDVVHLARVLGIISACAEQTQRFLIQSPMTRDHLRVCGADSHGGPGNGPNLGSSPRVRSRLHAAIWLFHPAGIISACAEQTRTLPTRYAFNRDHLRVCGADLGVSGFQPAVLGSSPRVRSRLSSRKRTAAKSRIISACAEQTDPSSLFNVFPKDHLRVCGADCENRVERPLDSGSSPRVRSRQRRQRSALRLAGIISACAEQTNPFHVKRLSARDHLRVCGADE